jgi:hypothetical protein
MQRLQLVPLVLLALCSNIWADEAPKFQPEQVQSLQVYPLQVKFNSGDDAAQLIVTGTLADGRLVDVTHLAKYSPTASTTVTPTGRVTPLANGSSEVAVQYGKHTLKVPVQAAHVGENLPINFTNQVVPVFTKLGCNSGGCHGKASGQNGFKLSLLGFEPDLDFMTLVKESRGRRLFPSAPDQSLFLLKAIGAVPHGGGRKMEPGSEEYKIVRRWIAAGMPFGNETDPTVSKISVFPEHRILDRHVQQQFAVYAHYTDGTVEDITRRAQFESNDVEIANVDGNAVVRTLNLSGEAAIMARYQGHVVVFRATVPRGGVTPKWSFTNQTFVDQFTSKKWKELDLVPSELSSDEVFARRIYLDLTGTMPTPSQLKAFVADTNPKKRDLLIEKLLDSPSYAYYFANKWADILRVKRRGEQQRAAGTFAFHSWIREAIASEMPYSEFVRSVLAANGSESQNPPTVWFKELEKPENFVDDTAQVFLGLRMACANCHHHPYEKWSQDDYWGLAAFFGRLGRKQIQRPGFDQQRGQITEQLIYTKANNDVRNKRTNKPAAVKPLDGSTLEPTAEEDPRQMLVDWMVNPQNPFFAKALVNRYWAHFFGRGIVDPLDDMRVTNPPSNPELLDALAKHFLDSNFSTKEVIRAIVKSRTYQLSATPNDFNKHDKQAYARYYPKRLSAEVLLDAVNQVTDSPNQFGGLPRDKNAPSRAIQLPDESFSSYFLDVFGRPSRSSACECERVSEANLAQALHLLNSEEIQQKITRGNARADMLSRADDKRPDAEKVEELFLWTLGRKPTDKDLSAALAHLTKHEKTKKTAYENLIWALINTKEFIFNQ